MKIKSTEVEVEFSNVEIVDILLDFIQDNENFSSVIRLNSYNVEDGNFTLNFSNGS